MVLTKEELGQQVKDTYNKGIATGKTREEVIGAMKNQLQTTGQYDAAKQIATGIQTPEQAKQDGVNVLTPEQLKVKNNVVTQPEVINPPTLPIAEVKPTETPEIQAQDRSKYIDTNAGTRIYERDLAAFNQGQDTNTQTEKVTTETPEGTTVTTTETPKNTGITAETQWENTDKSMSTLENMIEARYPGAVATQNADGSITADINGEKFQWKIGADGKPAKTSLGQSGMNPDTIYASLVAGVQVDKNIAGYTEAKKRFDSFRQYSAYGVDQLSTLLSNGNLLEGTSLYNDMYNDPATRIKLENAQKLNTINKKSTDIVKVQENQTESIISDKPNTINAFQGGLTTEEYSSMLTSPDINAKSIEVEGKINKYNGLKAQYDAIEDETRAEYKGYSERYIQARIGEQQKNMYKQLVIAQGEMNTSMGTLSDLKNEKAKVVEINLGLYNQQVQREQQLQDITSQREYQSAQDVKNFEQQKEIMKLQQDYQNADIQTDIIQVGNKNVLINRKTGETIKSFDMPTEAVKTSDNKYIEVGDKIYDATNDRWISAPGATGNTTSSGYTMKFEPQNNYTGYADVIDSDLNRVGSDGALNGNMIEQAGNEYGVNPALIAGIIRNDSANGTKVYSQYNYGNVGNNDTLVASGGKGVAFNTPQEGVNAVAENIRKRIDTYKSVFGVNSNPSIKELLTGVANNGNKFYGVYMTDKTGPARVESIVKSLDKGTKIPRQTSSQYSEGDIELLSELANMDASARNTALKNSGMTLKDVTDYTNLAKQGKIPFTSSQKKDSNSIIADIKDLINMSDWQDAVGKSTMFPTVPGGDASSAENAIDNLRAKLTMKNLGLLKGPMSDKDLAFLSSMSNKLQLTNSDEQFSKNLVDLYNINARINGLPEVTTIDEIKGTMQTGAGGRVKGATKGRIK